MLLQSDLPWVALVAVELAGFKHQRAHVCHWCSRLTRYRPGNAQTKQHAFFCASHLFSFLDNTRQNCISCRNNILKYSAKGGWTTVWCVDFCDHPLPILTRSVLCQACGDGCNEACLKFCIYLPKYFHAHLSKVEEKMVRCGVEQLI